MWPESSGIPAESQLTGTGETGVLTEPPLPQRKSALTPRPQRDGSPRETERKPEPAVFSPSPVVGQEQPPPMRTHVPETESSESDASDEPGPKEDPPHLRARPASDLEGDQEAAELDQEEAGGAEPSAQLELAILNGLDISSLPALRDLSTRASTTWSGALRQRPECRLDAPDTTTGGGIWTARMHNSTVRRVLDGLVSARATGHREPEGMNEILRRGIEEQRSQRQASPMESSSAAL